MRAVVGLSEIVWYYRNLRQGFQEIGIDCWQVNLDDYVTYDVVTDSNLLAARIARRTGRLRRLTRRSQILRKSLLVALDTLARTFLFVWCLVRCDIFVLGRGTSFLHPHEGAILRALGKKIFRIYHGSDERPIYASGSLNSPASGVSVNEGVRKTRELREQLRVLDQYATAIVSNPLSSHLHDRDIVIYQYIGHPFTAPIAAPREEKSREGALRIVHSPSDEVSKGSTRIREAVARVKAKGYKLELIELVNVPNSRVLEELARCDFVIDQAYSDTPMSGFAAEAAAFGKPAVVGGYGWSELETIMPRDTWAPTECCRPDELDIAIERLARDADYRDALGHRARDFVITAWSSSAVAKRLLQLGDEGFPTDWRFYPSALRYTRGCGMDEERGRQVVREVLAAGGVAALQLDNKPEFEKQYVAFASNQ